MKAILLTAGLALYAASGLFVVKGNERALVTRMGRADQALVGAGLHYDLPWPWARVRRVNLHELRTVSVGLRGGESLREADFLRGLAADRQGEFLTGDKNVLHLQIDVQYSIVDPYLWLFGDARPERGVRLLTEALATDVIARSGVDFVHPLGLDELTRLLTRLMQHAVEQQPWGVVVDDVSIGGVFPPVEVKAAFLDVSNARAEKDRLIHEEHTRGEQRLSNAQAAARQRVQQAETERNTQVEGARGAADRFARVIAQFHHEAQTGAVDYRAVKQRAMSRMYAETLETVLPRLAGKVFLDSDQPVDLTIAPDKSSPEPASAAPSPEK